MEHAPINSVKCLWQSNKTAWSTVSNTVARSKSSHLIMVLSSIKAAMSLYILSGDVSIELADGFSLLFEIYPPE